MTLIAQRSHSGGGRAHASGALLSSLLVAGCASNAPAPQARAPAAITPARAEANHGNPPFYDVFGERYFVLASSEGYRERGIASWYGRDFHGRPAAAWMSATREDGKKFNPFAGFAIR